MIPIQVMIRTDESEDGRETDVEDRGIGDASRFVNLVLRHFGFNSLHKIAKASRISDNALRRSIKCRSNRRSKFNHSLLFVALLNLSTVFRAEQL